MANKQSIFDTVVVGRSDANISFNDLCHLVQWLGFVARRVKGSHHIFAHPKLPEIINLQPRGNKAKPYQVKQVRDLILRYNLSLSKHAD